MSPDLHSYVTTMQDSFSGICIPDRSAEACKFCSPAYDVNAVCGKCTCG